MNKKGIWYYLSKLFTGTNDAERLLAIGTGLGKTEQQLLNLERLAQLSAAAKVGNGFRYGMAIYGSSLLESGVEARDGYRKIKEDLIEMIEKSLKTSDKKTFDDFISAYIKNPEETQIEGLINDSDVYEFYLKFRNDIDDILSDKYFRKGEIIYQILSNTENEPEILVKENTDGVILLPSQLGITSATPFFTYETTEKVLPKSIPIESPIP